MNPASRRWSKDGLLLVAWASLALILANGAARSAGAPGPSIGEPVKVLSPAEDLAQACLIPGPMNRRFP
jgi:phage baseplate assembly protein gpV